MPPKHASTEKPQCTQCSSSEYVIPIIYGKPTAELLEQWKQHEILLGGGLKIDGKQPPWTCTRCDILIDIPSN